MERSKVLRLTPGWDSIWRAAEGVAMPRVQLRRKVGAGIIGFCVGVAAVPTLKLLGLLPGAAHASLHEMVGVAVLAGIGVGALFSLIEDDETLEKLHHWFWSSPRIRWMMIFICAFASVLMSLPMWSWLVFGIPYQMPIPPPPLPVDTMWVIAAVVSGIPYLAACVRLSEDIDLRRGIAWPLRGKAWWMAVLRIALRAIGLIPVTVAVGCVGLKVASWIMGGAGYVILKFAPQARPLVETLFVFVVEACAALVIIGAWWLCVRFLARRAPQSVGAGDGVDALFDAASKTGAFARGIVFISAGTGLAAADWWRGHFKASTGMTVGQDSLANVWEVGRLMFYACAVVLVFMGLREWRTALKGAPRLVSQGVHGNTGDAGPKAA